MRRRHARALHVRDQADAAGPEPRVLRRTRDLRAEFRAERAEHGGDVHPHLLEHPALHARSSRRRRRGCRPRSARCQAVRTKRAAGRAGLLVLDRLERGAEAVAQPLEPGLGGSCSARAATAGPAASVMGGMFPGCAAAMEPPRHRVAGSVIPGPAVDMRLPRSRVRAPHGLAWRSIAAPWPCAPHTERRQDKGDGRQDGCDCSTARPWPGTGRHQAGFPEAGRRRLGRRSASAPSSGR